MDVSRQDEKPIPEGVRASGFYRRRYQRYIAVLCVCGWLFIFCLDLGLFDGFFRGTHPPRQFSIWMVLVCLLPLVNIALIVWIFTKPMNREAVIYQWRELRRARTAECVWCGYNTTGCPTPACSECGKPIDPPAVVRKTTQETQ